MSRAKPVIEIVILAAIHVSAPGCRHVGATDTSDAGNDAGVSTDTDLPEGADPVCSATLGTTCATLGDWLFEVELDAEALAGGGSWRFVDIGGYHGVLAERDLGDGPEPVVVFPDPWIDGGIQLTYIAVLPEDVDEDVQPIGITASLSSWNDPETKWLYAVLTSASSGYAIYGVPRPKPGGDTDPEPNEDPTGLPVVTMHEWHDADDLGGFAPSFSKAW